MNTWKFKPLAQATVPGFEQGLAFRPVFFLLNYRLVTGNGLGGGQ